MEKLIKKSDKSSEIHKLLKNSVQKFLLKSSQMTKVFCSFFVLAFVAMASSQQHFQLPTVTFDMNEFMAHQQQHQPIAHETGREAQEFEAEPQVGSALIDPFIGLKLAKPFWGLGLPGMRFSNINAGHFGGLHFGNALLGAGNPQADAEEQNLGDHHHHHHHLDDSSLDGQQGYQMEPQVGAAQQAEGFWPFHHWINDEPQLQAQAPQQFFPFHHFANQEAELGAAAPQHFDHMQFPAEQLPVQPDHFQVGQSPMHQFEVHPVGPPSQQHFTTGNSEAMIPSGFESQRADAEQGARTWGKWGKKDDYGYR